jgi:hypothetical protein
MQLPWKNCQPTNPHADSRILWADPTTNSGVHKPLLGIREATWGNTVRLRMHQIPLGLRGLE